MNEGARKESSARSWRYEYAKKNYKPNFGPQIEM